MHLRYKIRGKYMKLIKIILLMPFFIYLICALLLLILNENIKLLTFFLSLILLFTNGYGLTRSEKKWNIVSFISIAIFTIWYSIMGYFDYVKWTSTRIAIFLLVFYISIFTLKIFSHKKKN